MNRTSIRGLGYGALLAGLAITGCASTKSEEGGGPSKSLVHARELDQVVARAGIANIVPAEVHEARSLLVNAEKQHKDDPQSNMEKHLAALAASRFEVAMAEAHRLRTEKGLAQGVRAGDQTAELEAERAARLKAEQEIAAIRATEEGAVITLTGAVLFESDQSDLLPIAKERLTEVAEALKDTEGVVVIEGHADARGPEEYNVALSNRRARAVQEFLVELGMSPERIRTEGVGEKDPIATNDTPEGRANNRRVEIIVDEGV